MSRLYTISRCTNCLSTPKTYVYVHLHTFSHIPTHIHVRTNLCEFIIRHGPLASPLQVARCIVLAWRYSRQLAGRYFNGSKPVGEQKQHH